MNPLIAGNDIFDLIPQRPPIVMIDAFYGFEGEISLSGLTITKDNIFCKDNLFQEPGIIEHIAQSAAARVGYSYWQKNEPVPLGFIASLDKVSIEKLPACDETLLTKVSILTDFGDFSIIGAEVISGDEVIATCKMKILMQNEKA